MRFAGAVLLLAVCSTPAPSAELWRFVHPDAKALVGIDWRQVQKSEVGRWFQQRWISGMSMPGPEFLDNVEQVLISSPGPPLGNPNGEPSLLVAIRGTFALDQVKSALLRQGNTPQMFGAVPVYRSRDNSEPAFALLDAATILIGDPHALYSTIERSRLAEAQDTDQFLARARTLATRYDCWALMKDNGAMHNFLFASLAGRTLTPDSQGFEAGISVRDGLAMDIVLSVRGERAAHSLHANLVRLVSLAGRQQSDNPGFSSLLGGLKISSDRSNVFLSLRMTNAEVQRSLSLPSRAPAKQTIRIEGLDEGTREVPFKP